ncbi:MAG: bifunctional phosphoglucose/phosphomannose isomerase [Bacteroidota bacterium]
MPRSLLDAALDPQDMRGAIAGFPDHLADGWGRGAAGLGITDDVKGIVICGMGGSAIGADLVRALSAPDSRVPVVVNRAYGVPGWVGETTLVIGSSYSGGTEETLSAFEAAREAGAKLAAVTSGGTLAEKADGYPTITIPGGMQPRAALGYSLGVLLRAFRDGGLLDLSDDDFLTALGHAKERAEAYGLDDRTNLAREVSGALEGKLPVVYTGPGLLEPVGMRWRTQIHENAKHPAYGNVFPELDHNEIMAFEAGPTEVLSRIEILALLDVDDHGQTRRRFEITKGLVARTVSGWREIESEGDNRLDRMLSLVQLGDWVSFWLAMRKGEDPTPVETIQNLKAALAG